METLGFWQRFNLRWRGVQFASARLPASVILSFWQADIARRLDAVFTQPQPGPNPPVRGPGFAGGARYLFSQVVYKVRLAIFLVGKRWQHAQQWARATAGTAGLHWTNLIDWLAMRLFLGDPPVRGYNEPAAHDFQARDQFQERVAAWAIAVAGGQERAPQVRQLAPQPIDLPTQGRRFLTQQGLSRAR